MGLLDLIGRNGQPCPHSHANAHGEAVLHGLLLACRLDACPGMIMPAPEAFFEGSLLAKPPGW